MLNNFENLINREVVRWLEPPVLALPGEGLALLAVGFELEQRVVDAVKQHLVVDVFALGHQHLALFELRVSRGVFQVFFLSLFLPALFKGQVQIERQNHGEVLLEVLAAPSFGVAQLLQEVDVLFGERLAQGLLERGRIHYKIRKLRA